MNVTELIEQLDARAREQKDTYDYRIAARRPDNNQTEYSFVVRNKKKEIILMGSDFSVEKAIEKAIDKAYRQYGLSL